MNKCMIFFDFVKDKITKIDVIFDNFVKKRTSSTIIFHTRSIIIQCCDRFSKTSPMMIDKIINSKKYFILNTIQKKIRPGNPGSGQGSGFENFPGRVPGFEIFCPVSGPGSGFHFKIFRVPGRADPWLRTNSGPQMAEISKTGYPPINTEQE